MVRASAQEFLAPGACHYADDEWSRWMAAAQNGDQSAYDRLLRAILPYLRTIIAQHHRRPDRIEEIVQDVLLTIHRARHAYDPGRPFRHWVAAIARHRSLDALRRHCRRAANEIDTEQAGLAYEAFADPQSERFVERHAAVDDLGKAIGRLSPLQREAIEFLKLREVSLLDASRATGRSIAALKVNVHRAMKSLQRQMQEA